MIKDSGERREFESGAVRDIQEGKGRCDLLPLLEVSTVLDDDVLEALSHLCRATSTKVKEDFVKLAFLKFCNLREWTPEEAILEVSKHYEEGAKKYGEWNWQKGIPTHSFIDSAVRHYLKWSKGDTDEPHDRAFIWNLLSYLYTVHYKPEFDDLGGKNG